MPSGFVQNINQLSPAFYRVVIDLTGYPTTDGNTNGAVSPTSSDNVGSDVNQITALPTTLAAGKQRARGNMRFRNIVNRLSGIGDCQILDIEVGGQTTGDSQATSLAFTVKYERPQDLLNSIRTAVYAESTSYNNAGSVEITTTALGIEELVVRAVRDATTANVRVYNGTAGTDNTLSITVAAPDTAANVLADVTVALIDGTELITTDESGTAE
jgi:hypothetical protein